MKIKYIIDVKTFVSNGSTYFAARIIDTKKGATVKVFTYQQGDARVAYNEFSEWASKFATSVTFHETYIASSTDTQKSVKEFGDIL